MVSQPGWGGGQGTLTSRQWAEHPGTEGPRLLVRWGMWRLGRDLGRAVDGGRQWAPVGEAAAPALAGWNPQAAPLGRKPWAAVGRGAQPLAASGAGPGWGEEGAGWGPDWPEPGQA